MEKAKFEGFERKRDLTSVGRGAIDVLLKHNLDVKQHSESQDHNVDKFEKRAVLGNPELPIYEFREKILDTIDENEVTIITAETGSGKTTQVPQFLAENGYKVIVTQPRILAARSVSERVGEEVVEAAGDDFGDFVGYRTARERGDSPENRILFVTDGLQMVRELNDNYDDDKKVLVLDEVHEWNTNMEVLIAWSKKKAQEDPNFKLVVMSATMNSDKLAEFFQDKESGDPAPVIEVPGRTFPVAMSEGRDVLEETIRFSEEGKNTLVFAPGKGEIEYLCKKLEKATDAVVLPLHGELQPSDQKLVFKSFDKPKIIVSTNVAQTSVTIDDINAVVDSGLERQSQVKNNIKGLYLKPISRADCTQRAGRAGRTQPGEYVLAPLRIEERFGTVTLPFDSFRSRQEFPVPEILRDSLDSTVLHLARANLDAAELDFFHQPEKSEIISAKERLFNLGAINKNGEITKIGREMERLAMDPHYARMMIEARKYGDTLRLHMAGILAVQSVGGIRKFGEVEDIDGNVVLNPWVELIRNKEGLSGAIQEYEIFVAAQEMSNTEMKKNGIMIKNFHQAREMIYQIRRREKFSDQNLKPLDENETKNIIKCIVAGGMDKVFIPDGYWFENLDGDGYNYGNRNLAQQRRALLIADPRIIQTRQGRNLPILENGTFLGENMMESYEVVNEVAPHLCREEEIFYVYSDDLRKRKNFYFKDKKIFDDELKMSKIETPEQLELVVERAVEILDRYEKRDIEALNKYTGGTSKYSLEILNTIDEKNISKEAYLEKIEQTVRENITDEDVSVSDLAKRLEDKLKWNNFISEEWLNEIAESHPSSLPYAFDSDGEPKNSKDVVYEDGARYINFYHDNADTVKDIISSRFFERGDIYREIEYYFDFDYNARNSSWPAFKLMKELIDKRADDGGHKLNTLTYEDIVNILSESEELEKLEAKRLEEEKLKQQELEEKRLEEERLRKEREEKDRIAREQAEEIQRQRDQEDAKRGVMFSSRPAVSNNNNSPFAVLSGMFDEDE